MDASRDLPGWSAGGAAAAAAQSLIRLMLNSHTVLGSKITLQTQKKPTPRLAAVPGDGEDALGRELHPPFSPSPTRRTPA